MVSFENLREQNTNLIKEKLEHDEKDFQKRCKSITDTLLLYLYKNPPASDTVKYISSYEIEKCSSFINRVKDINNLNLNMEVKIINKDINYIRKYVSNNKVKIDFLFV